jgi:UDP-N-acetylmuramate dehydrogenase
LGPETSVLVREQVMLSAHTTLRLGGPAARFVAAGTEDQLVAAVRAADADRQPVLVLGGGSNLVVSDAGFAGTVVRVASRGIRVDREADADLLTVAAGEDWDSLVQRCVADGLAGVECLSGIPGLVGATPIQNVGAYGQEVAEIVVAVRAYDRQRGEVVRLSSAECEFGYRTSAFKRGGAGGSRVGSGGAAGSGGSAAAGGLGAAGAAWVGPSGRFVVLAVSFRLPRSRLSAPVRYAELARVLGVREGDRVPLSAARTAVLALRRSKGMVLDPADPDTRNAGSFFTNPVLGPAEFAALERRAAGRSDPSAGRIRVPRFDAGDGCVKVPAAWLIEQAGFSRGYPGGPGARISAKHTLALINQGEATTAGLLRLAREIRAGVQAAFGIELVPEPVLVGEAL